MILVIYSPTGVAMMMYVDDIIGRMYGSGVYGGVLTCTLSN